LSDRYARFVLDNTRVGSPPLAPEIVLHLADSVTPLWQATEDVLAAEGLPPPYWAFAWPGGQALARFLLDLPRTVRGLSVLDFAAGCGLAAIAAARSGAARVIACEIDPFAVAAIGLNALNNGVEVEIRAIDLLDSPPPPVDLILAGDICYERPLAERVTAWLTRAADAGAQVFVADPGRVYAPTRAMVEIARFAVPTSLDLENRTSMPTVVYRLLPTNT
jgi:predicted nicotinamide N-methyase